MISHTSSAGSTSFTDERSPAICGGCSSGSRVQMSVAVGQIGEGKQSAFAISDRPALYGVP